MAIEESVFANILASYGKPREVSALGRTAHAAINLPQAVAGRLHTGLGRIAAGLTGGTFDENVALAANPANALPAPQTGAQTAATVIGGHIAPAIAEFLALRGLGGVPASRGVLIAKDAAAQALTGATEGLPEVPFSGAEGAALGLLETLPRLSRIPGLAALGAASKFTHEALYPDEPELIPGVSGGDIRGLAVGLGGFIPKQLQRAIAPSTVAPSALQHGPAVPSPRTLELNRNLHRALNPQKYPAPPSPWELMTGERIGPPAQQMDFQNLGAVTGQLPPGLLGRSASAGDLTNPTVLQQLQAEAVATVANRRISPEQALEEAARQRATGAIRAREQAGLARQLEGQPIVSPDEAVRAQLGVANPRRPLQDLFNLGEDIQPGEFDPVTSLLLQRAHERRAQTGEWPLGQNPLQQQLRAIEEAQGLRQADEAQNKIARSMEKQLEKERVEIATGAPQAGVRSPRKAADVILRNLEEQELAARQQAMDDEVREFRRLQQLQIAQGLPPQSIEAGINPQKGKPREYAPPAATPEPPTPIPPSPSERGPGIQPSRGRPREGDFRPENPFYTGAAGIHLIGRNPDVLRATLGGALGSFLGPEINEDIDPLAGAAIGAGLALGPRGLSRAAEAIGHASRGTIRTPAQAAERLGIRLDGEGAAGLHFTDPITKTTLVVPPGSSPEVIRTKLVDVRHKFARGPSPEEATLMQSYGITPKPPIPYVEPPTLTEGAGGSARLPFSERGSVPAGGGGSSQPKRPLPNSTWDNLYRLATGTKSYFHFGLAGVPTDVHRNSFGFHVGTREQTERVWGRIGSINEYRLKPDARILQIENDINWENPAHLLMDLAEQDILKKDDWLSILTKWQQAYKLSNSKYDKLWDLGDRIDKGTINADDLFDAINNLDLSFSGSHKKDMFKDISNWLHRQGFDAIEYPNAVESRNLTDHSIAVINPKAIQHLQQLQKPSSESGSILNPFSLLKKVQEPMSFVERDRLARLSEGGGGRIDAVIDALAGSGRDPIEIRGFEGTPPSPSGTPFQITPTSAIAHRAQDIREFFRLKNSAGKVADVRKAPNGKFYYKVHGEERSGFFDSFHEPLQLLQDRNFKLQDTKIRRTLGDPENFAIAKANARRRMSGFVIEEVARFGLGFFGGSIAGGATAGPDDDKTSRAVVGGILGGLTLALGPSIGRAVFKELTTAPITRASKPQSAAAANRSIKQAFSGPFDFISKEFEGLSRAGVYDVGFSLTRLANMIDRGFNVTLPPVVRQAIINARGMPAYLVSLADQALDRTNLFYKPSEHIIHLSNQFLEGKMGTGAAGRESYLRAIGTGSEDVKYAEYVMAGREAVTGLQKILGTYITDPRTKAIILKSLDQYLHRTYKLFTDPKYAASLTENQIREFARHHVMLNPSLNEDIIRVNLEQYIRDTRMAMSSPFMPRKDIPKALKEILGEVTNPSQRVHQTIARLRPIAEVAGFYGRVVKGMEIDGLPAWFASESDLIARYRKLEIDLSRLTSGTPEFATVANQMELLRGYQTVDAFKNFGIFEGGKVSRHVYDQMTAMKTRSSLLKSPIFRGIASTHTAVKLARTAANPLVVMRNYMTAPVFAAIGRANPQDWPEAFRVMKDPRHALRKELIENGIIGADHIQGELYRDLRELQGGQFGLGEVDMSWLGMGKFDLRMAEKVVKRGVDKWLDVYRAPDVAVRIASYISAKRRFNGDVAKAVEFTNRYTMNYDMVAPVVRIGRQLPFMNLFLSYASEMARLGKNLVVDASRGDLYAGGLLATLIAVPEIVQSSSENSLSATQKKEWDKIKSLLPDYGRTRYRWVTGKNPDGSFGYVDITPWLVQDNYQQMVKALAAGDMKAAAEVNPLLGWENTPLLNLMISQATGTDRQSHRPFRNTTDRIASVAKELLPPWFPYVGSDSYRWTAATTPTEGGGMGITSQRTGSQYTVEDLLFAYKTGMRRGSYSLPHLIERESNKLNETLAIHKTYANDVLKSDASRERKAAAMQHYKIIEAELVEDFRERLGLPTEAADMERQRLLAR